MSQGLRVEVFWNLRRKCFSIRPLKGQQRGLVCLHTDAIFLEDVTFAVQPAGRERVLREKRKNVHAFVRGTLVATGQGARDRQEPITVWDRVTYNPYTGTTFMDLHQRPVLASFLFRGVAEAGKASCWIPCREAA